MRSILALSLVVGGLVVETLAQPVLHIQSTGPGQFRITLTGAQPGAICQLSSKQNLLDGNWIEEITQSADSSGIATFEVSAQGRSMLFFQGAAQITNGDSDADGIPDWWMNQYFGHPTGWASDHSRAQDSFNGDGVTNFQKFLRGANPRITPEPDIANSINLCVFTVSD